MLRGKPHCSVVRVLTVPWFPGPQVMRGEPTAT